MFVGRFLITVSISVLLIGLLIISFSCYFGLGRLYFSKTVHFFQVVPFINIQLLVLVPHDPLYFCGVSFNFSFFISNFIDLGHLCFFLDKHGYKGLSVLFVFLKKQLLVSLIFAIIFFFFTSFISAVICMISFLLLT